LIWLTTGNSSNAYLSALLEARFTAIAEALALGEPVVELTR
jgi:predicted nuclease of predicted toxin-antitoxin system